jgi:very-short-patch-repair endonuclease
MVYTKESWNELKKSPDYTSWSLQRNKKMKEGWKKFKKTTKFSQWEKQATNRIKNIHSSGYMRPDTRKRNIENNPSKRPEVRKKIKKWAEERFSNPKNHPLYGKKCSWTTKRNLENNPAKTLKNKKRMRKIWSDPNSIYNSKEYREKILRNSLKALLKRPTKLEQKFIEFFNRYSLPFNYCGNGSLIIGGKNPDFVENNGRKICLEVTNKIFREKILQKTPNKYEQERISHFVKYGWKCLVLWEDELNDKEKLVSNIKNFIGD